MQLSGVWVIELAELDSMNRAGVDVVKSFISRFETIGSDLPTVVVLPKSVDSVFSSAPSNGNDYLKDETGGRRFWPVQM